IVEQGQGVRAIAKNLKDQGLIKDPVVFFLLTKKLGIDSKIEAGDYRLFPSMSAFDIATGLTHGTLDIWITIPEGQRAAEIAEQLKAKMPNYDPSWDIALDEKEGYLFPDTYLLPKDADITIITDIMRKNFDAKYETLDTSKTNLSKEEIVTLASLIEREAKHDADRPLVSSVINNRLGLGMKLDIDATLQYILGYQEAEKRWWKKELTNNDKTINSPYNTYRVSGLPPGPISNPGLTSLEAAINPAKSDYLYYITDGNGINHYAETFSQHEANIEKYGL
ncbi:MAG: endolytic transglycosylase MltG, partial [Patescibacteria group bacterium]